MKIGFVRTRWLQFWSSQICWSTDLFRITSKQRSFSSACIAKTGKLLTGQLDPSLVGVRWFRWVSQWIVFGLLHSFYWNRKRCWIKVIKVITIVTDLTLSTFSFIHPQTRRVWLEHIKGITISNAIQMYGVLSNIVEERNSRWIIMYK